MHVVHKHMQFKVIGKQSHMLMIIVHGAAIETWVS